MKQWYHFPFKFGFRFFLSLIVAFNVNLYAETKKDIKITKEMIKLSKTSKVSQDDVKKFLYKSKNKSLRSYDIQYNFNEILTYQPDLITSEVLKTLLVPYEYTREDDIIVNKRTVLNEKLLSLLYQKKQDLFTSEVWKLVYDNYLYVDKEERTYNFGNIVPVEHKDRGGVCYAAAIKLKVPKNETIEHCGDYKSDYNFMAQVLNEEEFKIAMTERNLADNLSASLLLFHPSLAQLNNILATTKEDKISFTEAICGDLLRYIRHSKTNHLSYSWEEELSLGLLKDMKIIQVSSADPSTTEPPSKEVLEECLNLSLNVNLEKEKKISFFHEIFQVKQDEQLNYDMKTLKDMMVEYVARCDDSLPGINEIINIPELRAHILAYSKEIGCFPSSDGFSTVIPKVFKLITPGDESEKQTIESLK